ncbi:hypothetical protein GCM10028895_23380 [Pontibacter rugosus]
MTGLNKAICSNMVLKFGENKLKTISFLVQPDASFIPPHELKEDVKVLEGFTWMAEQRPTKKDVLAKPVPVPVKTKPKEVPKQKKAPAKKPATATKAVAGNKN